MKTRQWNHSRPVLPSGAGFSRVCFLDTCRPSIFTYIQMYTHTHIIWESKGYNRNWTENNDTQKFLDFQYTTRKLERGSGGVANYTRTWQNQLVKFHPWRHHLANSYGSSTHNSTSWQTFVDIPPLAKPFGKIQPNIPPTATPAGKFLWKFHSC